MDDLADPGLLLAGTPIILRRQLVYAESIALLFLAKIVGRIIIHDIFHQKLLMPLFFNIEDYFFTISSSYFLPHSCFLAINYIIGLLMLALIFTKPFAYIPYP
ncbi:hypothetical protein ACJX0J_016480 [Zea mays]